MSYVLVLAFRFLVVTCSGPDICDMSCSLCDLWAWPWAMKLRLTVRPLTDWLLIVCTRLLSTLSPPPHTHSLIRGILGEFMHRLLANWISHIVSTVCPLWMPHNVGLHGTDPPPPPHPTPNNAMTTMASLSCSSQRPASGSITGPSLTSWIGPDLGGQVTYRAGLIHGYYYSMLTNVKHDHRLQVNNTLKIYMYVLLLYMHVTFTLYSLFE